MRRRAEETATCIALSITHQIAALLSSGLFARRVGTGARWILRLAQDDIRRSGTEEART